VKDATISHRNLLFLSDLHIGSIFGMLPPGFIANDGSEVQQNPGQKYLWECFSDMIACSARFRIDAIFINGDLIDGRQPKSMGIELSLPLPNDQEEAAVFTLRYLRNQIQKLSGMDLEQQLPMYIVQGTEYHDGRGASELESIAARLDAVQYHCPHGTGRFTREVCGVSFAGVNVNLAHHVGGGGGFIKSSGIDRELLWSAIAGAEDNALKADLLVRSHLHYFIHLEKPTQHAVITPCWQLQTRFMRKRSAYAMRPDIGAVIAHVDGAEKIAGRDPVLLSKMLYPLPEFRLHTG
jgi:hypothetical protein